MRKWLVVGMALSMAVLAIGVVSMAQEGHEKEGVRAAEEEAAPQSSDGIGKGLKAIGVALALGLCALGTGYAQARIGSAGIGAIAEDRKLLGAVIILVAIPETMLVFGFAMAAMILSMMK